MRKKWFIGLSILVLIVSFLPNILQSYRVHADDTVLHKENIQLLQQTNFKISYSMYETPNNYEWQLHYKYDETEEQNKYKVELEFVNDGNISTSEEEIWHKSTNKQLIAEFDENIEGDILISSDKSLTQLALKVKVWNVASKEDGKTEYTIDEFYSLFVPKLSTEKENRVDEENYITVEESPDSSNIEEANELVEENEEESTNLTFRYPINFGIRSPLLNISDDYVEIAPEYTLDEITGKYPTYSWQATGDLNVINHQGRLAGDSNWDGRTNWDGNPSNKTDSYIEYPGTNNLVDFALRKYAKETTTPGLLDVYLNVRGNVQNPIKPVDLVLVVDMSGSMAKEGREQAVKEGVKSFLNSIANTAYAEYVNVGLVGYSDSIKANVSMDNLSKNDHIQNINKAINTTFTGGTFTQIGIREGSTMLKKDTSENEKMMILMTDGVPTYSYHVTSALSEDGVIYGQKFSTTQEGEGSTSELDKPYEVDGLKINDTWASTLGEARIAKEEGAEIHALGIQLGADKSYLDSDEVRARTSLIASPGLYQDAGSAGEVTNYLKDQANVVLGRFNTITAGSISDPLGPQFNYNNFGVEINSVGQDQVDVLPTVQINNGILEVSNLNLGKNQEVQLHYQVRLNTETEDFKSDYWYQLNGETTLTPNGNNPDNKVSFGVPSAKLPATKLTVEKQWISNQENIPDKIDLSIGRSTEQEGSSDWYRNITLEANKDWTSTIENLPKFSSLGEEFKYEITDEVVENSNWFDWSVSEDNPTSITNIERFQLQLIKTSSHSNKPLENVEFRLEDDQGNEIKKGLTNSAGELHFGEDVRLEYGREYTLYETKASGHKSAGPWKIKVDIENQKPVVTIDGEIEKLNSQHNRFMISLQISNDINVEEFNNSVNVDKRDIETDVKLEGAVFNLYSISSVKDKLEELQPLENMTNLLPGLYAIQEKVSPNGYYRDDEAQFFQVKFDGDIVALDDEGSEISFLKDEESWQNGFTLTKDGEELKLTLHFYNRAAPPLYLEVEKIDNDFSSPLSGVTFELRRTESGNVEAEEKESLLPKFQQLFSDNTNSDVLLLQSNIEGKLAILDTEGNLVEGSVPVTLDYDTQYKLTKKDSVGLFPDFSDMAEWTLTTPNMDDLKIHEEDNGIEIKGEDLLVTPDDSILGAASQPATALGVVPLIKTENPDFQLLEDQENQIKTSRMFSDWQEELSAYVISFEIHSNVTHSFTIEKIDGSDSTPMDTQFSLRWVEKYTPSQEFSSLESLDISSLKLSGNDISSASETPIDATAGATLSTIKGSKTLDHMARGNLYIISEETPPTGYQKTNTVIVAYMDKEQGYAEAASIHIRLARRSEANPDLLEFGNLEDFVEYKGSVGDELGIVFANYKEGVEKDSGNEDDFQNSSHPKDNQNSKKEDTTDSTLKIHTVLPKLGTIGIGMSGVLLIILMFFLSRRGKK